MTTPNTTPEIKPEIEVKDLEPAKEVKAGEEIKCHETSPGHFTCEPIVIKTSK